MDVVVSCRWVGGPGGNLGELKGPCGAGGSEEFYRPSVTFYTSLELFLSSFRRAVELPCSPSALALAVGRSCSSFRLLRGIFCSYARALPPAAAPRRQLPGAGIRCSPAPVSQALLPGQDARLSPSLAVF